MEAITSHADMIQTPATTATVTFQHSAVVRAAAIGLVFSLAFSSSFVLGFYLLGPWIDAARTML